MKGINISQSVEFKENKALSLLLCDYYVFNS